ncbi:MAG: hypothetical protein WCV86_04595 [Patescibacteria group bacterium]|jgi:hypothetical protein
MRLSGLQKDILKRAVLFREPQITRAQFAAYYEKPVKALSKDQQNALTTSLERLIDKGLLVGFGRRTQEKWFIESVRLTPQGRRIARPLFGTQGALSLTRRSKPGSAGKKH